MLLHVDDSVTLLGEGRRCSNTRCRQEACFSVQKCPATTPADSSVGNLGVPSRKSFGQHHYGWSDMCCRILCRSYALSLSNFVETLSNLCRLRSYFVELLSNLCQIWSNFVETLSNLLRTCMPRAPLASGGPRGHAPCPSKFRRRFDEALHK